MLKLFRDWLVFLSLLSWAAYQQMQISRLVWQINKQLELQHRVVELMEHVNEREHRLADWLQAVRQPKCKIQEYVDTGDNKR